MANCIAALATAVGKASLTVVRISGSDSFKVAAQVFRPMDKRREVEKIGRAHV